MSDKEAQSEAFRKISGDVMRCYHEKMHEYLNSKEAGTITDADVVIMIMNLTIGVATNMYYSLKQILPTTTIDFDFIKAKVINSFVDGFEKIKEYTPKNDMFPLTADQVKEIAREGHVMVTMPDGKVRKVTKEDILIKKEDVEKIAEMQKKEVVGAHTPKIIVPGHNAFSRKQS